MNIFVYPISGILSVVFSSLRIYFDGKPDIDVNINIFLPHNPLKATSSDRVLLLIDILFVFVTIN